MVSISNASSKRKIYLDFLKIIAIYLVLFNHTKQNGWALFTVSVDSALYPFYLFIAVLTKINVPIFFMCTGAVLLHKNEPYKILFRKRVIRIVIVLIVGSFILYLYNNLRWNHEPMNILTFSKTLYTSNIRPHLWFLYAYLAFVLMLPFLRRMAQSMKGRDFVWLTIAYGIYRSLFLIEFLLFKGSALHNSEFYLFINLSYIYYPLMGYYIENRLNTNNLKLNLFLIMTALSIIAISVSCFATHYRCSLLNEWQESQPFVETFIFIPTITAFYGTKLWFSHHPPGTKKASLITLLGTIFLNLI